MSWWRINMDEIRWILRDDKLLWDAVISINRVDCVEQEWVKHKTSVTWSVWYSNIAETASSTRGHTLSHIRQKINRNGSFIQYFALYNVAIGLGQIASWFLTLPLLGEGLIAALVYLWAQNYSEMMVQFMFGFTFKVRTICLIPDTRDFMKEFRMLGPGRMMSHGNMLRAGTFIMPICMSNPYQFHFPFPTYRRSISRGY